MVAPVVVKSTVLKGLVLRLTREDHCGTPLCGDTASVVTKGFIEVNFSPVVDTGTDFTQKLSDGSYCTNEKDCDTVKWYTTEIKMCGVDPSVLELAGGKPLVLDYAGKAVGFDELGVACETNFGLELWNKVTQGQCDPSGDEVWDYQLVPGNTNMIFEDINFGNKYVDFTMKGNTFFNTNWCKGPYDVVPQVATGHAPGPMLTNIGDGVHFRNMATTVAPPTPATGYTTVACAGEGTDGDPAVVLPCS